MTITINGLESRVVNRASDNLGIRNSKDSSAKFTLLLNNNYLTTGQTWHSGCASSYVGKDLKPCDYLAEIIHGSMLLVYYVECIQKFVDGVIHESQD